MATKTKKNREIKDYDSIDTTDLINPKRSLKFEDLDLKLPELPPTQVVSIRLPTKLLHEIRAMGSEEDIPYQALIKMFLSESVEKRKKKKSA